MNRINKNGILIFYTLLFTIQGLIAQPTKTLTLKEVIELAKTNSNQLKLVQNEVTTSKAATQLVKNSLTPSAEITVSGSYIGNGFITNRDFSGKQSVEMPHWGNNFAIEASQVIFSGGAISANIAKARLKEQIAQLNYQRNELDICFLVTGYYLDLYKLSNQREIFQKNIEQINLLIEQIKSKESQGMALSSDITRHELMLQNLKLELIEIENNSKIINQQMVVTLGLPSETVIVLDSSVLKLDVNSLIPDNLVQRANDNLPELKMASLNKEVAMKEIRMAKADYYPTLALVAANHMDGPILIEVPTIDKNFNYWYVGLGLKYNISALYKTRHKIHLAAQKQSAAEYSEVLAQEQTYIRVNSTLIKLKESVDKLQVYETSLQLATENYRLINNRYLNDLVLITEMLDASNTKLNAELQLQNAKLDVVYNYYKLQREIGNQN